MRWKKMIGSIFIFLVAIGVMAGCSLESKTTLYVYTWADNFNEDVIKQFEKKYNVRVNLSVYSSNEAMYQKLKMSEGQYDIIQPSDYMVSVLIKKHMIEKINKQNIPNLQKISMEIKDTPYDPKGEYTVLYDYGITGIAYNKKYVKEPPTSWKDLWDKKYAGHVALLDDSREVVGMLLFNNG